MQFGAVVILGVSYQRAFYSPETSPEEIRKRIIASSPYYFAARLPVFELHQGTEDQKTTGWHARLLGDHLREFDMNEDNYRIYIYEIRDMLTMMMKLFAKVCRDF